MKKSLLMSLLLSMAVLATGCSTYTDSSSTTTKTETTTTQETDQTNGDNTTETKNMYKEITIATGGELLTLDASKSNDGYSGEVLYHTSEGLLRTYDNQMVPGMAESYEVSEDGLVYTFHLREANWQDGQPITAEQFVYSFQRFFDPNTGASEIDNFLVIKNAKAINAGEITDLTQLGVVALDEKTVQITLETPAVLFLQHLASSHNLYPLRQEFVEACGESYGTDAANYMASGPFKVTSWVSQSELVYEKNESYWNADNIKMDKINRVIIADANTRVSMYDNGETDINVGVPALSVGNYNTDELLASSTGTMVTLQLNLDGTSEEAGRVLSNLNFRKALSYAIDRTSMVNAIVGGCNIPAGRLVDPEVPGTSGKYVDEYPINEEPLTANPEKAKEYLAKALEELGMTVDELPTFTYVAMESSNYKLFAEAVVDSWKTVLGLDCIDVQQYPVPTAITNMLNRQYDMYWQQCGSSLEDPYDYMAYWTSDGSINVTGWEDENYTDLIYGTNTMTNRADRLAAFAEAEQYILDNGPQIPIYYYGSYYTVKPGIQNILCGKDMEYIYADLTE